MGSPVLYMLCGLPASGKSTFAREQMKHLDSTYFSRDEIRFTLLKDSEEYFAREDDVFNLFSRCAAENLKWGYNTIIDATHLNAGSRSKILKKIDTYYTEYNVVFINFYTPYEICFARNRLREGRARVPDDTMQQMLNRWQPAVKEEDSRCVAVWNIKGGDIRNE